MKAQNEKEMREYKSERDERCRTLMKQMVGKLGEIRSQKNNLEFKL